MSCSGQGPLPAPPGWAFTGRGEGASANTQMGLSERAHSPLCPPAAPTPELQAPWSHFTI